MKLIIATFLLLIVMALLSSFYGSEAYIANKELSKSRKELELIEQKRSDELNMLRESAAYKEDYSIPRSDLVVSFTEGGIYEPSYDDEPSVNSGKESMGKLEIFFVALGISGGFLIVWVLAERLVIKAKRRK